MAVRPAGALLVFAFLVVPGVAGLRVAGNLRRAFVVSVAAAFVAAVAGLYLSFVLDLLSAATIIALSCRLLGIVALLRRTLPSLPLRG